MNRGFKQDRAVTKDKFYSCVQMTIVHFMEGCFHRFFRIDLIEELKHRKILLLNYYLAKFDWTSSE